AATGVDHDVGTHRVAAAEYSPGRHAGALEPRVQRRLWLHVERAVEAAAAAKAAGAAGVGPEAVAADERRVLRFEDLDRVVLEAAVHIVDQPVLAVASLETTPAA